jgi:hypothetical protein
MKTIPLLGMRSKNDLTSPILSNFSLTNVAGVSNCHTAHQFFRSSKRRRDRRTLMLRTNNVRTGRSFRNRDAINSDWSVPPRLREVPASPLHRGSGGGVRGRRGRSLLEFGLRSGRKKWTRDSVFRSRRPWTCVDWSDMTAIRWFESEWTRGTTDGAGFHDLLHAGFRIWILVRVGSVDVQAGSTRIPCLVQTPPRPTPSFAVLEERHSPCIPPRPPSLPRPPSYPSSLLSLSS